MGKTITIDIHGSSQVGLFAYATDSYCLIGQALPQEAKDAFTKALDVPVIELTIGGSSQVGAYLTGTNSMLFTPDLITQKEKDILDKNNIAYTIIETKHTALGNNILINDNYCFYIKDFEKHAIKTITDTLSIPAESLELDDWEVIGSIMKVTSKGGLIQKDVPDEIKDDLEQKMKVKLEQGTVNFGSHILSGGIVANKNGMVIGKASAGIEITNADMALGFLE